MGRSVLFLLLMVSASQAMSGDSDDDAKSGEKREGILEISHKHHFQ
jgi:hypothetical protein